MSEPDRKISRLRDWWDRASAAVADALSPTPEPVPVRVSPSRRPPARRRRGARGFSLLEVMISSSFLIVSIAGTLSAFSAVMDAQNHQKHLTTALQIAEAELEGLLLRYSSDDELESGTTHPTTPLYFNQKGVRVATAGASTYEVTWETVPHATLSGIRNVIVTVEWKERSETKSFQLSSYRN